MKAIIYICLFVLSTNYAFAQWGNLGQQIKDGLSNKAQQKIKDEINSGADKTYNKTKESVKNSVKNSGSKDKSSNSNSDSNSSSESSSNTTSKTNSSSNNNSSSSTDNSLKSYGKFDFVPGEKVIAIEDFSQDAIGDFPDKWNTNGTGEIVTLSGRTGRWLKFGPNSIIYPEFITNLPENFTVEFDLACTQPFSYYSSFFSFFFAPLLNPAKNFVGWKKYDNDNKKLGVSVGLHPQSAGTNSKGQQSFISYDEVGKEFLSNQADFAAFNSVNKNIVKVSVWRQKQRLRVYVDETKIIDIPKAFDATAKYNFLGFRADEYYNDNDAYFFANLRVAIGAPDTRNKFIDVGKYSTTGIKFDVNSDKIKAESYGTLKDFATVLQENPTVRVKIVGHTDSDGDDANNLALSKKRAESVKNALNKEFGIELSRMETDGKGESQPADTNATVEGKANNRRVEFIKL